MGGIDEIHGGPKTYCARWENQMCTASCQMANQLDGFAGVLENRIENGSLLPKMFKLIVLSGQRAQHVIC